MSLTLAPPVDIHQITSFPQMRKLVESLRAIDGQFTDGATIRVDALGRIYAVGTGPAVVTWDGITGKPVLLTLAQAETLFQPMSGNLFAIAAISGTGLLVRINPSDWAARTIAGVADRTTVADGDGVAANPVIDIAATYPGQNSIVTVGTITVGDWQATVIATQFGGTGQDTSALVADRLLYTSGTGVFSAATITAYIRTLLAAVDAAAARTVLDAEQAGAAAAAQAASEPALGNPTNDGDVLASTIAGVRSWVTPGVGGAGREMLTAARTYYVRTDGDDANDGLTDTAGGAFLTIQKAVDVVCGTLDLGNYNVTIQVGNGTYTTGVNLWGYIGGTGNVTIEGDVTTPANVVIAVSASGGTSGYCVYARQFAGYWILDGLRFTTTGSGNGAIRADAGTRVLIGAVDFGPVVTQHMLATQNGGWLQPFKNYTISGGGQRHGLAQIFSQVGWTSGITVTLTGTPNFTSQFVNGSAHGLINAAGVTWTGAATGQRYNGATLGLILVGGGGVNYFPGNVAGVVATGAIYS